MHLLAKTIKFAKAHNQGPPFIRVYIMAFFITQDCIVQVGMHDANFNARQVRVVSSTYFLWSNWNLKDVLRRVLMVHLPKQKTAVLMLI
jgi:hypothetical protein